MEDWNDSLQEDMSRYIGQTVTIFTTSGGISGYGFTGVLISVSNSVVRLLVNPGEAPSCPVGSTCTGYPNYSNLFYNSNFSPLGALAVIPTHAIAAFTHNAI